MNTNETVSPYWQIQKEDAPIVISYRYDEKEGKVIRIESQHDESGHLLLQQAWNNSGERTEEARRLLLSGQKSPLLYHMERINMELLILAATVSLPKWKVKRHFRPNIYKKLKRSMLERYANAFNMEVEDLDKID
jgi:hypothetical protein